MSKQTLARESLPDSAAQALVKLGRDIRTARKLRGITAAQLAERTYTTRATITRLENGHPGVSLTILAHALWVLQLENNLGMVADPQNDLQGALLPAGRLSCPCEKRKPGLGRESFAVTSEKNAVVFVALPHVDYAPAGC